MHIFRRYADRLMDNQLSLALTSRELNHFMLTFHNPHSLAVTDVATRHLVSKNVTTRHLVGRNNNLHCPFWMFRRLGHIMLAIVVTSDRDCVSFCRRGLRLVRLGTYAGFIVLNSINILVAVGVVVCLTGTWSDLLQNQWVGVSHDGLGTWPWRNTWIVICWYT